MALAVILVMGMAATAQTISIRLDGNAFKVIGWRALPAAPGKDWSSIFAVYTGSAEAPPLLGTYAVEDGVLVFRPRFPFAPGVQYRAVFRAPGAPRIEQAFDGPVQSTTPSTRVLRIYPSSDVLPSNELRIYVYFSAPMSRGEAAYYIHMLDAQGKVLQGVFLPAEELWDPAYQRLTLTFDPGRIKRGLTSNEKLGPAIVDGARYTLAIDRGWQDARGVPLAGGFQKSFRGGPAQRNPPDPKQWQLIAPKAGSSDALVVVFPTPMNYPLLQRMLRVGTGRGDLAGAVDIERGETQWRFTPREPWKGGNYQLVVDSGLEDLAGNHLGQAFDIDVFERVTEHITSKTIALPFIVR